MTLLALLFKRASFHQNLKRGFDPDAGHSFGKTHTTIVHFPVRF